MPTPLRVLLIEDSEIDAALLVHELRRGGYAPAWERVMSAAALDAALAEPWDLVLCDWRMPGFGGAAALERLRARGIDAPVIIVSSDLGEEGAIAAMRGGASDYVTKRALVRLVPAIERALRDAEIRRAHRRAETALRESEARFSKAFELAPIGMALVGLDGTMLRANRALCEMLGYADEELRGRPVWQWTHPDDMPATIAQLQRLVEDRIDTWDLEKRYFHRDGHILWGRSITWLVRAADGRALYVVSQVQDITERRRLEEQTHRQQAELAHALRVATMGEMVAEIAHEMNQPLASIANFANGLVARLERGAVDVAPMREAAAQIAAEALRASDVIRRVREFLHKGEPKRARCDANDVVRVAVQMIEPDTRQHGIRLEVALAPGALPVEVDRIQIEQVVLNLLRNAVDALIAGHDGRRALRVESAAQPDHTVAVRVYDSGVGLPPGAGERIFDAFFTTKRDGLGLGLAISRSLVEAHGGRLWATANPNGGTTVAFTLPAAH